MSLQTKSAVYRWYVVFLLLRDEDVDRQLGPEAGDALHQLERGDLQLAVRTAGAVAVVLGERVERVVDQHRLDVAVRLDGGERLLGGGDAGEGDAERVIERAGGGVQALDELAQHQVLVVDDEDAADGLRHRGRKYNPA